MSEKQKRTLLEKTRAGEANWKIAGWLHKECGAAWGDNLEIRDWAKQELQNEENKRQKEIRKTLREEGSEDPQAQSQETADSLGEGGDTSEEHPTEEGSAIPEEERGCVTCGDPQLLCACKVKKVSEIPF